MTSLELLQAEVAEWGELTLDDPKPWMAVLKVCEEAGELAGAVVKPMDGAGRAGGDPAEEAADTFIALLMYCNLAHIDLAEAALCKMRQLWKRP